MSWTSNSRGGPGTIKGLLEEALACIRAVEIEVFKSMPEKVNQVRTVRSAIESLLRSDQEIQQKAVQNYQQEIKRLRAEIAQTDWRNLK